MCQSNSTARMPEEDILEEKLYERLSHLVDLRIPGFEKSVPPGKVRQLSFSNRSSIEWFEEFVERATNAIGRRYLPIFRVSDGEFYFSVGYRLPYPSPGEKPLLHYLRQIASYIKWNRFNVFWSGTPGYGYENYSTAEWKTLRPHYVECLRTICREGIMAMALMKTPDRFAERYHRPICEWFETNKVAVIPGNYYPFYFVYGLLNGPSIGRVLQDRRVLVVTSLNPNKEKAISLGLLRAGARDVQFIQISRGKALTDRIDLSGIAVPVDVALVGAGVGAANILVQLRELRTLCIDAGYSLDLIADRTLAGSRDFTLAD